MLFKTGLRSISAAEAIRFGMGETSGRHSHLKLAKTKLLSTNLFLGISDVLARKQLYATMLVVVMLGAFLIIVPQNLYHTISSENFVTYMGIGRCDLRMDIQKNSDITGKTHQIAETIASDGDVSDFVVLTTKTFGIQQADGKVENIKVELGDHTVFPVMCAAWSIVCIRFFDSSHTSSKLVQYMEQFDYARVSSIDDYISQTFGQTLHSVCTASLVAVGVAIAVTLLVTLLFLKLLIAKDAYSIADLAGRDVTQVSGGQLQRAGICRALMNSPKILFADEPTGALNSKASAEMMDAFSAIHQNGTAILLVTHDAKVAARAQRVLFMQDGEIVNQLVLDHIDRNDLGGKTEKILVETRRLGI